MNLVSLRCASVALAVSGCASSGSFTPPTSPFEPAYSDGLHGAVAPDPSSVQAAGTSWRYTIPIDEVWNACIAIAAQKDCVLALEGDGSERSLLVLQSVDSGQAPGGAVVESVLHRGYDRWIALAAEAEGPSTTTVSTAMISAYSSELEDIGGLGDDLLYQISTQLQGDRRWLEKFVVDWTRLESRGGVPTALPGAIDRSSFELETTIGAWVSRRLLDTFPEIESPELTAVLEEMVRRLRAAAKIDAREVRVHILASREDHAFALPNGEVFICSGLLDTLQSPDELAAVLAHELDHLGQHDTIRRLESYRRGRRSSAAAGVVTGLVGMAVSLSGSPGASYADQLGSQLASGLISEGGLTAAAHLGTTMVTAYNEDAELRADRNGASYAYAAGFSPTGMGDLLHRLHQSSSAAADDREPIISNFLAKNPGIERRIEQLEQVESSLLGGTFDPTATPVTKPTYEFDED